MATVVPPLSSELERGPALLAIYWTQFAVALVAVVLRFYARFSIHAIGWDDWTMAITMVLDTGCTIIQTVLIKQKALESIEYVSAKQLESVLLLWLILQPLAAMAVAMGRISVAVLLLRIIGPSTWRKCFLYFSVVSTLLLSSVYSIVSCVQCRPVESFWNKTVPGGRCLTEIIPLALAVTTSGWNAFMDICLALIPLITFSRLQMNHRKKVGLCILMSLGIVAAIAAVIKAREYWDIGPDFTWSVFDLYAVSGVELLLIIVCACIPTLKPLYDRCSKRRKNQKRNNRTLLSSRPTGRPGRPPSEMYETRDSASDYSLGPLRSSPSAPWVPSKESDDIRYTSV